MNKISCIVLIYLTISLNSVAQKNRLDTLSDFRYKLSELKNWADTFLADPNEYHLVSKIKEIAKKKNIESPIGNSLSCDKLNSFLNNIINEYQNFAESNRRNEIRINQYLIFRIKKINPIIFNIDSHLFEINRLIIEEESKILNEKLKAISGIRDTLKTHATLLKKDSIDIANLKTDNQCLDDSIKAINIRLDTTKKYYDSLLNAANKKIESLEEKLNCKIDSLNFKQNLINKENKRSVVYLDNNLSALNQYLLSSDCKIDSLSFQISLQEERIKELENKQPVPSVTDTTNLSKRIDILENQLITLNLDNISIKLRLHQLKMREIEIGRIKEKLLSLNSIISYHHTEITRINTNTRALNKTITSMNKKIITIEPVPNPKNYKQNKH